MTKPSHPKPTLHSLQGQFRDLCVIDMKGAAAIADFREDPTGNLQVVKESTARINEGLTELKKDLENAKVALPSGEEIYCWEYEALEKISSNAGLSFEEITGKIKVRNGSAVTLDLDPSSMADLGPLVYLTALKDLRLIGTQVSDLTPLIRLTMLERVDLGCTPVSDISPLANLTALERLCLENTLVSDISQLAKLTALEQLYLANTPVSDFSPLAKLTALEMLDLGHTQVSLLTPLSKLAALEQLALNNTLVSDLTPIAKLPKLKQVWLRDTPALTDPASQKIMLKLESKKVAVHKV